MLVSVSLLTLLTCQEYTQSNRGRVPGGIYDWFDLQAMKENLNGEYTLLRNIEIPPNTSFFAIGTEQAPFTGSLDGRKRSISGLEIRKTDNFYQGLFGVIEGRSSETVVVKDLVLKDVRLTGKAYVGSLVGWIKKGIVEGITLESEEGAKSIVTAIGNIELGFSDYGFVGSLIGLAGTEKESGLDVQIKNVNSAATVIDSRQRSNGIGGLVGYVYANAMVTESYFKGEIRSDHDFVGGLVGENRGGVHGSYMTGNVIGFSNVGGLVGINYGVVSGYVEGKVEGKGNSVGGLVGENRGGSVTGYTIGNVFSQGNFVGGLVGNLSAGMVNGYSRSKIYREGSRDRLSLGKTIGNVGATAASTTYSSTESKIYMITTNEELQDTTGENGVELGRIMLRQNSFRGFDFEDGTIGTWIWVLDNKWPAINVGTTQPGSRQPIDSVE